jgi:PAS domain S-box-containing protein
MSKSPNKILVLSLLCALFIPPKTFCSTDQKKTILKNQGIQHEMRMVDSLNDLAGKSEAPNINLSKDYANKALTIAKSINYLKGERDALSHFGQYYLSSHFFSKSLEIFFSTLQLAREAKDTKLEIIALKKICIIFAKLKLSNKARLYFNKSFSLALINKDTINIIDLLICNSEILETEKEWEKSKTALYQALWFSNTLKDPKYIAFINKHIGDYYLSLRELEIAKYYYKKAIDIDFKNHNLYNVGSIYSLLSQICFLENKLTESLNYNLLALKIRQQTNQEDQFAYSLLNIGKSYLLIKKFDSAYYYLTAGLEMANKLNNNYLKEFGYKNIYDFYILKKDFPNALKYFQLESATKDSINIEKNREDILIFEAKQTLSENEKKSELIKAENQHQKIRIKLYRIQILLLGILLLIILVVLYTTYRRFIRNKKSKITLQKLNEKLDIEIKERKQVELQLRKSETLHRFLTDNSLDVISRIDNKEKFVYISPSCINIFGYDQKEILEMDNTNTLIDPSSLETFRISFNDMLQSKEPTKITFKCRKKDGTLFWVESYANPIFDQESGDLKEVITVARDISKRIAYEETLKESARQKEFLMSEIHHRAKNNFAILFSLLSIQKSKTQNHELIDILSDVQTRIRAMVLIHEQLYRSKNIDTISFGQYIIDLEKSISIAFKKEGITLHSEISECQLNIETALPLGLVVNELLTNSYKYAFTGRNSGTIHIKLAPVLKNTEDKIRNWEMIIEDDGIGLPESFNLGKASSMGSQIIQMLVDQINSQIYFSGNGGASFRIIFPGTIII